MKSLLILFFCGAISTFKNYDKALSSKKLANRNFLLENTKKPYSINQNQEKFKFLPNEALLSRELNGTCIDEDLYGKCLSECRIDYLECLSVCDNSICHNVCLSSFLDCDISCPCGEKCPEGCSGCDHHLCEDICINAETENSDYIVCLKQNLDTQNLCIENCKPNSVCHKRCFDNFETGMKDCPCYEENPVLDPSDVHILVVPDYLSAAYIVSGDGSTITTPTLTGPSNDYLYWCTSTVIQNELYIFGGNTDYKKIAKLSGCQFQELAIRLNYDMRVWASAIAIDNQNKALICFAEGEYKNCEIFDLSISETTHASQFSHEFGRLGMYKGNPTTVGTQEGSKDSLGKVESYSPDGWNLLGSHPKNISAHVLIGLDDGSLLLAGGYYYNFVDSEDGLEDIWLLKNDVWSIIGKLKEPDLAHSGIKIGQSIYLMSGEGRDLPVQRIDLDGDVVVDTQILGYHPTYATPALFNVESNFCV